MNEQVFQLVLIGVNAFGALAWWAIRQEVKHVRELLTVKIQEVERRLDVVEEKCLDCPSRH